MRVAILQHAEHEGPGQVATWCAAHGMALRTHHPARGDLPPRDAFDALVVLGGPQSVYDTARDPWLVAEIAFLREVLATDTPVLGICLGSQLLAAALGADVARHSEQEIGWYEVTRAEGARVSAFADLLPARLITLHWHGDAYALPAGATRLFSSAACMEQGFSVGARVLALQFHPEMTADMLPTWIAKEPPPVGRWCQTGAELMSGLAHTPPNHRMLDAMLARLFA
jgi:GMP synthase-like glutamine amidotransferase